MSDLLPVLDPLDPKRVEVPFGLGWTCAYRHPGSADGRFPPQFSPALVREVRADGTADLWVFGPMGLHHDPNVPQNQWIQSPIFQERR